jgi:hypothetical protein
MGLAIGHRQGGQGASWVEAQPDRDRGLSPAERREDAESPQEATDGGRAARPRRLWSRHSGRGQGEPRGWAENGIRAPHRGTTRRCPLPAGSQPNRDTARNRLQPTPNPNPGKPQPRNHDPPKEPDGRDPMHLSPDRIAADQPHSTNRNPTVAPGTAPRTAPANPFDDRGRKRTAVALPNAKRPPRPATAPANRTRQPRPATAPGHRARPPRQATAPANRTRRPHPPTASANRTRRPPSPNALAERIRRPHPPTAVDPTAPDPTPQPVESGPTSQGSTTKAPTLRPPDPVLPDPRDPMPANRAPRTQTLPHAQAGLGAFPAARARVRRARWIGGCGECPAQGAAQPETSRAQKGWFPGH